MFSSVYFHNYRNLDECFISFRSKKGAIKPTILFFGENGVGKTSVIQALSFIKRSCEGMYLNELLLHQESSIAKPFLLKQEVCSAYTLGSKGCMTLLYEINHKKEHYLYELRLNPDGSIARESLIKENRDNTVVLFAAHGKELYMATQFIPKSYQKGMIDRFLVNNTSHTFLSQAYYAHRKGFVQFKDKIRKLLRYVAKLHIQYEGYRYQDYYNITEKANIEMHRGVVGSDLKPFMTASEVIINAVVKQVYPTIDHVKYNFRKIKNRYHYELETFLKTPSGIKKIQYEMMPASYHELLDFFNALLDAYLGGTIIYDNMSAHYTEKTLKLLIDGLLRSTDSQVIFALNSTDLMNEVDHRSIYIYRFDDDHMSIRPVDELDVIRENHNIRKRYENGQYGSTLPKNDYRPTSEMKILAWFSKHMINFKRTIGW